MKIISIILTALLMTTAIFADSSCVTVNEEITCTENCKYKVTLSNELIEYIKITAEKYDIDYRLPLAIMYCESRFKEHVSNKSGTCYGLMQVTKIYESYISEKLRIKDLDIVSNSEHNIEAGLFMLSEAFYEGATTHDAVMSYNKGIAGARRYMKKYGKYNSYTERVMEIYNHYIKGDCK
jgi:Soluble lytic murein transglycosylase and related regulatory proteins (some contain LysM/invasin domains)